MEEYNITHPDFSDVSAMKTLWQETFGDTREYINIVFDNYFDSRYCLCAFDGKELIASMVGIPYNFNYNHTNFRGLYLCGLATKSPYRNKGIMGRMLELIPEVCRHNNLHFSFLIPADDHLRNYYKKLKYIDSAPIKNVSLKVDYIPIITQYISSVKSNKIKDELWKETIINKYEITDIIKWDDTKWNTICSLCTTGEESNRFHLQHTFKDWRLIITEKLLSGSIMVEAYVKSRSYLFILEKNGRVDILVGAVEDVRGILENLVALQNNLDKNVSGLDVRENPNVDIYLTVQKYGMVRLSDDFIERFVLREGSNENSIFEKLLVFPRKYGKMKYEDFISILKEILCSNIHFSYMLD